MPTLPAAYSEDRLRANLAALAAVDGELALRLAWPVRSDHVGFDALGRAHYRLHRTNYRLELSPQAIERACAQLREAPGAREALLCGLGAGELADQLLGPAGIARLHVWERDPWLVRLELMRADRAAALRARRLVLHLTTDLAERRGELAPLARVVHPFLGQVYAREIAWLGVAGGGPPPRAVLLASGGLFVEQLGNGLLRRGFQPWTLDLAGLSREELERSAVRLAPALAAAINVPDGLAEFCSGRRVPLMAWEIDPSTEEPGRLSRPCPGAFVFSYRRANVAGFREAGYEHVEWLPLAADVEARHPEELSSAERERYGAPLAFVGSSLCATAAGSRRKFTALWGEWRGNAAAGALEAEEVLEEALAAQRGAATVDCMGELLEPRAREFLRWARARARCAQREDPLALAREIAASEKRLGWAGELGTQLWVWGDPGWKLAQSSGVRYMGPAGHQRELTKIYGAARVVLDLNRLYQADIVSMRVFDALACGAVVLAEGSGDLAELLRCDGDDAELLVYRTREELVRKAQWALAHPAEARRIAARGRSAVLARHTLEQRIDRMLGALAGAGAPSR